MSFQTLVTERLADLTAKYNALYTNAKRIFELPVQNNLDPASLIHVSRGDVSESLSVQKIIDAVSAGSYDQLLAIGEIELVANVATIPANAQWKISEVYYSNIAEIEITVPYCATGLERKDILVANTSNNIVLVKGLETSSGITISPNVPIDTVFVTDMDVTDSSVGTPSIPILGDAFVKKQESQDFIANYGATTVIDQINLIDDRSSISLIGSATDVKSVQLSDAFIRPGKPHFFKNRTGHDVKLWHLAGTGNIKYFFPNASDLIVKPNEVIQFNTNANDSGNVRFEYVGGATAVTGAMTYKGSVANYAALPSTGLTIGDVYNLTNSGHNYVWSGSDWDDLGPAVDVSGKEDTSNKSNDIETDKTSTSKYGNIAAWISWLKTYFFSNLTAKVTPILADSLMLGDSADSNKTKKSTLQTIRDLFQSFFDIKYKQKTYQNVVHFGNSICKHPILSYWWGEWGMAATIRENDYVHRFLALLQAKNPNATSTAFNIAEWETNYATFDKTRMDPYLVGKDLVVLRLGENVSYYADFQNQYKILIQYIQSKVPNATIILGGQFWTNSTKERAMQNAAIELKLPFVSVKHLDSATYKQTVGAMVYGDDLAWHAIDNAGVANHPNDLGMLEIAKSLFSALNFPEEIDKTTPQNEIIGNVTLNDSFNGCIVKIKASATIIVPTTLKPYFNCVFDSWPGATGTFVAGSGSTILSSGLKLLPEKMGTLYKDGSAPVYRLKGETSV